MFDSSDQGLTERDLTDQRNDAMREGVKALVLMNGGGAVALLAFLQAIWHKDHVLAFWIVFGLAFLWWVLVRRVWFTCFVFTLRTQLRRFFTLSGLDHETQKDFDLRRTE